LAARVRSVGRMNEASSADFSPIGGGRRCAFRLRRRKAQLICRCYPLFLALLFRCYPVLWRKSL
jgi:hypothetical protein